MVLPWILSDSKSLQVSKSCLSTFPDLSNAAVRMVFILPSISNASNRLFQTFGDR